MASQDNNESLLNDPQRRNLTRRLLLEEQQRRIETRKMIETSYRSPICPHHTVSGHSDCLYCYQNDNAQPYSSSDTLLRSLTRSRSQATPTFAKTEALHLPSSASTKETINHLNQLIKPRSTASTVFLTDDSVYNQEPYRKLISSKPRMPDLTPTKAATSATALSVLTEPKSAPTLSWAELPVEKGFVPVRIPSTFSHFLSLPLEIRKCIYVYLVHNGIHGLLIPKDLKAYHQAPITRVNRQIRSESIEMVYTENAYNAKNRELIKFGPSFTLLVGDARLKLIRNFAWYTAKRYLYVNFSPCGSGYQYHITYDGPKGNEEVGAIARERAYQVWEYLKSQGRLSGFTAEHVRIISDIVLRIAPRAKAKVDEEPTE
ncbi:hypothetical protein QM012_001183 [Aureobasidium pullulans]|uniref:Uncharacterized protein n=1 Tax=Aureobasidium pullulans TaxID=5580 RepID=A0ABR0TFX7_AURPU